MYKSITGLAFCAIVTVSTPGVAEAVVRVNYDQCLDNIGTETKAEVLQVLLHNGSLEKWLALGRYALMPGFDDGEIAKGPVVNIPDGNFAVTKEDGNVYVVLVDSADAWIRDAGTYRGPGQDKERTGGFLGAINQVLNEVLSSNGKKSLGEVVLKYERVAHADREEIRKSSFKDCAGEAKKGGTETDDGWSFSVPFVSIPF